MKSRWLSPALEGPMISRKGQSIMPAVIDFSDFDSSRRLMALPVEALKPPVSNELRGFGLPAGSLDLPFSNLILCSSPIAQSFFLPQMERARDHTQRDVMLVRAGLAPEILNPVFVDVAMTLPSGPITLTDLIFTRLRDGSLWLSPVGRGAHLEIRPDGLALRTTPPFLTDFERSDGVCRAAAEIVQLTR